MNELLNMSNKIISSLYECYKNTPKKLKIICDWDEVIQPHEPYALWKALGEKDKAGEFSEYFKELWRLEGRIEYSPYGSKLVNPTGNSYVVEKQTEIKNSPSFYQEAPFLTIEEDLLRLIKEDKVEQIIFLVYRKVLAVEGKYDEKITFDDRIEAIFKETFGKFPNCSLKKIRYLEDEMGGAEVQCSKTDWIKENASDFDIVIDDNPNICRQMVYKGTRQCEKCIIESEREGAVSLIYCPQCPEIKVIAPYYPAVAEQHHSEVLLVKNEVSDLKSEDFQ